jgi:nuclear pore complex protein Nup98-Nup96
MGGAVSAVAGPVLGLAGGLISGGKAASAAKGQAEALRAAADRASAMAQFRPMGMTTAFGSSQFGDDGTGSYTLSPELKAIQDRLFGAAGQYDPTQIGAMAQPLTGGAQSLFNLGQQYLATSPEQAAQQYMAQQQGLLAPGRAAEEARLATANYGRGTGGLGVQTGTGTAPANPLAQALFNARAQQDATLAAQADEFGQKRAVFGAGLFGTGGELLGQVPALTTAGYNPLQTQLNLLGGVEKMGQQPFLLSQDLANQYAQAGANAGRLYLAPQQEAAQAYSQYQGYSPMGTALSAAGSTLGGGGGASSWFSGLFGSSGGGGAYGSMGGAPGLGGSMGTGLKF